MDDVPGMIRPDLQALPQVRDRMTFRWAVRTVPSR